MKRLSAILALGLAVACSSAVNPPATSTDLVDSPTTATTTAPPPPAFGVGDQIPSMSLWAMVDANDLGADRINLVFAQWGWDDHLEFLDYVSRALWWSS